MSDIDRDEYVNEKERSLNAIDMLECELKNITYRIILLVSAVSVSVVLNGLLVAYIIINS